MSQAVTSRDRGYDALLKRVFGFGHPQVAMGLLAADGATPAKGKDGDEPATLLQIGEWNEFGTDTIPERSFIRKWFDEASPQMRKEFVVLLKLVIQGKKTKEDVLELIGLRGQGQIQARIAAGIDPPNAPSTIAAKGSSTPLIGPTGQLRSAISYEVREAK